MYHVGRVVFVFSPEDEDIVSSDKFTQATVEMWDENLFTFSVESKISQELRENDFVLVDYTSISSERSLPRNVLVKILRGERGKKLWDKFKAHFEEREKKRKEERAEAAKANATPVVTPLSLKF
ncbi:MAG TPA: hypothetical protein VJI67_00410 [archaeon]|nr:hypothetical protein [archaeon]HLD81430.1 hypothetical protein [archaeon]